MITKKLQLKNNDEALELLGQQDVYLRQLEKRCRVEIFVRHDPETDELYLSIRGRAAPVNKALKALKERQSALQTAPPLSARTGSETAAEETPAAPPVETPYQGPAPLYTTAHGRDIRPRSENQKSYVASIQTHDLTIGIGPAGTGKTYLAVACAIRSLKAKEVDRIVLTRPVIETGEKLGFLPGDLYEKVHPYLQPLYDAFYNLLGSDKFRFWRDDDIVEVVPLAYMRGRTLERAFIILDEAQNTTPAQMKMFLTRMGVGSKIVITGDVTQIDLENDKASGLLVAQSILKNTERIRFVYFDEQDVFRHPLVKEILSAYNRWESKNK
ncbi:MAG: hypothetical protein A3G41_08425 [Elusimicrobia bacterium RIFCSPLOWO2_12_FULL_59_9]|nr:MAG: hypothetical protein A3G41_08425 [Elusimicrobia bacterium RIFCSPLOWO2_12_FULL_59_9]